MKKVNVYYLAQKSKEYDKDNNRQKNQRKKVYFMILISVMILFLLAYYYVSSNKVVLLTAEYNEIIDGFSTRGLLIRNEKKFYAEQDGTVTTLKEEGERVGYGQEIIKIDNNILYNYKPGLVSYAIDSLEEDLTPENINSITIDKFSEYTRKYKQLVSDDYIKKGQAVFRIINNDNFYIIIKTESNEVRRYKISEKVFVKPQFLNNRILEAEIIKKVLGHQEGLLVIKVNTFLKEWLNVRRAEFTFIKNIYRGITIPRKAIFQTPAGEGVLVYQPDGKYKFIEVTVLNGNTEFVVVQGIELGNKIVINPEDLDYGRGV